jgi:hypothetical protein
MVKVPTFRKQATAIPRSAGTVKTAAKVSKPKESKTAVNIRVPVVEQGTSHPTLYDTISLIGLLMAAMRAHEWGYIDLAFAHYPGFMRDLAKYKIKPPHKELDEVRHYSQLDRWDNAYAALQRFSKAFGPELRKLVQADPSVKATTVTALGTALDMIAARNPNRWGALESTFVSKFKYINNPELIRYWRVKEEAVHDSEVEKLAEVVKKAREIIGEQAHSHDDEYTLSVEQKRELRKRNPDVNSTFNQAYNTVIKKYRAALRNYILDHDNKPQPVPQAREAMEAKGYFINDMQPELDRLYIGSDGFFYTSSGLKILQRPQPGTTIMSFNPEYDPDTQDAWVFQYKTDEGEPIYAYTEKHKQDAKVEKNTRIMANIDDAIAKRPTWLHDLKNAGDERRELPALIVEIVYWSCGRIGSVGNSVRGHGTTYGISTLLVEHCHIKSSGVTLQYHGKDAVKQTHVFDKSNKDMKLICQYLEVLCEGKKPTDRLFTYENGKPVSADQVRAYMRDIGMQITPHDFRSVRGTKLMRDLLTKIPAKQIKSLTQATAEKLFKTEALQVGKLLGHVAGDEPTANTAIKAYIQPGFSRDWFQDNGWRVPLFIAQLTGED